jgi:hypothetical protein
MVTFIYFPLDSGVFDYLEHLEERLCRPKKRLKKFYYHYALQKTFRKINFKFGCKNDDADDTYVILHC